MAGPGRHRELKNYHDEDMVAAFGTDLWLGGSTAVPNLLLRHYRRIGLSDQEMMLVIQLMRLRAEEGLLCPAAGRLAECMDLTPADVEKTARALLDKELLCLGRYFDAELKQVVEGYDFGPLFKKLAAVWAGVKTEEGLEARHLVEEGAAAAREHEQKAASIYLAFEKEFGRPFTPIEIEQIGKWLVEVSPVLLMEALRQAVLRGKHNLKYIDSIVLQWRKNNLRTLDEVMAYEQQFKGRRKGKAAGEPKADDVAEAKRKELLKTMYAS
ncbi:MAG TPA: DnaD domain protein [Spirochaetia bacterium]|nr:DnaD domain protein [Spirochaetia bacterium]